MLLAAAQNIAECQQFSYAIARQRQAVIVRLMGDIGPGCKSLRPLIGIQAHAIAANQGKVLDAMTHQVSELAHGVEILLRQRCKGHEAGPLAVMLQGEKSAHARLGNDPLQLAVTIEICQGLLLRAVRGCHGDTLQRLQRAVDHLITHAPEWLAVVPVFITAVEHAGHAVVVQVNQLVALTGVGALQNLKGLMACGVGGQGERAVSQLQRWPVADCPGGVKGLVMHGLQQAGPGVAGRILQQQASGQNGGRPQGRFFREIVEHQDLLAKTPRTQLEAIGITAQWIAAFHPGCLLKIGGGLGQPGKALAVVKQQLKMPLLLRQGCAGPERQLGHGGDVRVADTAQVALSAEITLSIAPGVRFVVVADLLAVRGEAFFKQPLRDMARRLGVSDTRRGCLAIQMDIAICALNQPEPGAIRCR